MAIKILEKINAEQTAKLADKKFPEFHTGDIVRVSVRIKEGEKTRVQDFEGKVLAIDNGTKNASGNFTVSRDRIGSSRRRGARFMNDCRGASPANAREPSVSIIIFIHSICGIVIGVFIPISGPITETPTAQRFIIS